MPRNLLQQQNIMTPVDLRLPDCGNRNTDSNIESLVMFSLIYPRKKYTKVQGPGDPLLTLFLRRWKNNRVSRKPCKQRSDLALNGQMRVPK